MKKYLLLLAASAYTLVSYSQVLMNEFYVRPNQSAAHKDFNEYIELKNFSPTPVNIDNYKIVIYWSTRSEIGLYVVDMPNITLAPGAFLLTGPTDPITYQNGTVATMAVDFDWNTGYINRYVYTSGALTLNNTGAPFADIMERGSANGTGSGSYTFLLFDGNVLVDALMGASGSSAIPNYVENLGMLTHVATSGTLSFDFANINNGDASIYANVNPEPGTDNGFFRQAAGCESNGIWKKSSPPNENTPGAENPGGSAFTPDPADLLQFTLTCVNSTTVSYDITGGLNSSFPVAVSLYWDANGNQILDASDFLIGTNSDGNVNSPVHQFTKGATMEEFIFVFDAKNNCYDTTAILACPAIVLPVTYGSFTATRSGSNVTLNWETVSETDSKLFTIERNSNGRWEDAGYVASKAPDGKSNTVLSYSFTEVNTYSGISQYRLKQSDINGAFRISDIRTVRGFGQASAMRMYPNPTSRQVTLSFDDALTSRDVLITDMNGRVIQQHRAITDNQFRMSILSPGVYMIKVVDLRSGQQTIERLVVSGR